MTHDLVIVGGGLAGLSAATRATDFGLKPLILERGSDERYPCNSRFAGGVLHLTMVDMRASPKELLDTMLAATAEKEASEFKKMFANEAARSFEWLRSKGAKFVRAIPYRTLLAMAPPRPRIPGLAWYGRGPDLTLRKLTKHVLDAGGEIRRGVRAQDLIVEDGAVVGVRARTAAGTEEFRGGAVVIADGGFQTDLDRVRKYISPAPEKLFQRGAATGAGDGIRMAEAVGAQLYGVDKFYGHLLGRECFHNDKLWPYPILDPLAAAGMVVDANGKRFMDEGLGGVYMTNMVAALPDPLSTTVVFDETIWREVGGSNANAPQTNPWFVREGGTVIEAPDLKTLAAKIGVPADALEATVKTYNEAVMAGRTSDLNPPRTASVKLKPWPIKDAPFRAIQAAAGITYTTGGIMIDVDAQVVGESGKPIPGLFAAGAATGGSEGGPRAAYTGGLSKALITG
ncbi:MAG: FAD-dependent oxidoreductase, partial [Alphaproteobacteria bacterium]